MSKEEKDRLPLRTIIRKLRRLPVPFRVKTANQRVVVQQVAKIMHMSGQIGEVTTKQDKKRGGFIVTASPVSK